MTNVSSLPRFVMMKTLCDPEFLRIIPPFGSRGLASYGARTCSDASPGVRAVGGGTGSGVKSERLIGSWLEWGEQVQAEWGVQEEGHKRHGPLWGTCRKFKLKLMGKGIRSWIDHEGPASYAKEMLRTVTRSYQMISSLG